MLADSPTSRLDPGNDPLALTFGLGWGTTADSLPFAACSPEEEFSVKKPELLDRM